MLKGFYLTLLIGPVVPRPVSQALLDALTTVSVTSNAGGPNGFSLSFTLSQRSSLHSQFLIGAGQAPLSRVIIIVTINGTRQVLMDGVTTKTEMSGGRSPGQAALTVTGEDLTKTMNLADLTGLPYPGLTPEARVELIVSKYAMFGIIPLIIPSFAPDVPLPVEQIPIHQGTDLGYVRDLAAETGYVFYIDPGPVPGTNTAYWGPEIKIGVPQPALNLDMDAHTNVESLNFGFNSADTTLPIVLIQNRLTRIPIPLPIPNLNPLQPALGLIPAPLTNISVLRDTAKMSPMRALGRGLAEAARSADAVSAHGSLNVVRYGRVLRARQLVGVRGAGAAYDGLYFVKSVTSTIQRGEFKQSFELSRNGLVSITPRVPA